MLSKPVLPTRDPDDDRYTPCQSERTQPQARQRVLRYLRNLAAMLSKRDDVTIRLISAGKQIAVTNGNVIWIRNGDFTDPTYLALVKGLIDHEAGHVRHSDFAYLTSLKLTPLQQGLFNPIEDVRMERKVKAEYPGARVNLQKMCEVLVAKGGADYHLQAFPTCFQGFVMLYCRVHVNQDTCMEPAMGKTRCALVQMQGEEWVLGVETILQQVHEVVEMADVMPVVEQLTHCLDSRDRNENHDRNTEDSTNPDQETENLSGGQSQTSSLAGGRQSQKTTQEMENEDHSQKAGEDLSSQPSTSLKHRKGEAPLAVSTDLHEQARDLMASMAGEAEQAGRVDHFLTDRRYLNELDMTPEYFDAAESQGLYRQLVPLVKKAFFSMLPKPAGYRSRGRTLSPARFTAALTGNPAVFTDEQLKRQSVANVYLSIDCSKSMEGVGDAANSPMKMANNAVFALANALYQLPQVNVQVDYFTSYRHLLFYRACTFGKRPDASRFQVKPMHSTPTPSAVKEAVYQLMKSTRRINERNYLVLIADGNPEQPEATHEMLKMARAMQIRIFCIAIIASANNAYQQSGFLPDEVMTIQSASQLPQAFESIVTTRIFH